MRRLIRAALVALVALGCGSTGPSVSPPTSSPPSAVPTVPSGLPSPSPEVSPSASTSGDLALETVAEVVTDNLRVRSAPGVSDNSIVLEPLLQPGTRLFVVDGPVGASGYEWYEVLTFDVDLTGPGDSVDEEVVEGGWVAAADKGGEPWVEPAALECPAAPTTVADLVGMDGVTALACFGVKPLTLGARVLDCQESPELRGADWCGVDTGGPSFEPEWFDRTFSFLVPEDGSFDPGSMLELHADPLGTYPDPLPYGVPVDVTGQFNHPAASACTIYHYVKNNVPSVHCRTLFAVTAIASR
jgi:hypothetical protein